jgi:hypothetical protein
MNSETEKLPKGQSYPLKPSVLATALTEAGIDIDTHLIRSPGDVFNAYFWPPHNLPYERLYIRIGSVTSDHAHEARSKMEEIVVPRLVQWIAGILAADVKSPTRREKQSLSLKLP